ncbi:hypothetical protein [Agromyces archimandritae]|uniref:Uncharacterized protein n=1 Tax=Agromyces archimandritae TaxID=2781962 RepID=A0A975FNE8_9MICO|nr:hypothetical protein [Agromyces archimandritae]QTX05067.1 hypothetical protein G127AT_02155 [Agromyces archimandritae]
MRAVLALRVIVPSVWLGALVALSFVETPLKFLGPGITVPLGLGIGRLVFNALGVIGAVALIATTLLALPRPRVGRAGGILIGALWVVLAAEQFLVRPPLNARSDIVIAGGDPGESMLHYVYIVCDVAILGLLIALIVVAARRVLPRTVPADAS